MATGLVQVTAASVTEATVLAAGTQSADGIVEFEFLNNKEDNTLNGKTVYLKVTITVKAIQKDHIDSAADALKKLQSATFGA